MMNAHNNDPIVLMSVTHAIAVILSFAIGVFATRLSIKKRLTFAVVCLLASPLPLMLNLMPLAVDLTIIYMTILIIEIVSAIIIFFTAQRARKSR